MVDDICSDRFAASCYGNHENFLFFASGSSLQVCLFSHQTPSGSALLGDIDCILIPHAQLFSAKDWRLKVSGYSTTSSTSGEYGIHEAAGEKLEGRTSSGVRSLHSANIRSTVGGERVI